MVIDYTALREQRRPLWMSSFGIEAYADLLGGGGDIYTDRLSPEWERYTGSELTDEEFASISGESGQEGSEHSSESYSQESTSSETSTEQSPGINVGADVNVELSGVDEATKTVSDTVSKTTGALGGILKGATKKVKDAAKGE
jgi:hypothetical protein